MNFYGNSGFSGRGGTQIPRGCNVGPPSADNFFLSPAPILLPPGCSWEFHPQAPNTRYSRWSYWQTGFRYVPLWFRHVSGTFRYGFSYVFPGFWVGFSGIFRSGPRIGTAMLLVYTYRTWMKKINTPGPARSL